MEKEKILVAVILLLFFLNVYQYISYSNLKQLHIKYVNQINQEINNLKLEKERLTKELSLLTEKNDKLKNEFSNLQNNYSILREEYAALNESYVNITGNYTSLQNKYNTLKEEAEKLIAQLDEYAAKINESMSWFSSNSNIDYMKDRLKTSLANDLRSECYSISSDECRIKTSCFLLVNSEFYGLRYISDTSLYGKEDKLASLDEFLSNKGGDCEDYSLFYKAEVNNILNKCSGKKVVIESYIITNNGEKYYVNNRQTWYIEDAEGRELKNGNKYPYVVCYLTEPSLGHCVVAFSRYKINDSTQISLLYGAELVEPQDGSYVGEIGKEIRLPTLPDRINELMIVISDDDLYSFDENGWKGYKDFDSQIEKMKNELNLYLTK